MPLLYSVVTYAVMMALLLAVCLGMNDDGTGYLVTPFAMPVMPALLQLTERHVPDRRMAMRLVAAFAFVLISCIAFAVHWLTPDRLPFPARAPLWTAGTCAVAIPIIFVRDIVWKRRHPN